MKNITKLLSPTYVKLLNSDNQDLNWQPRNRRAVTDIQSSPNEDNLSVDLEVSSEDIEDGLYLKCLVWYDNEWNMELCTTSSITTTSDTATVHCECRFVSVFNHEKFSRGSRSYFLLLSLLFQMLSWLF